MAAGGRVSWLDELGLPKGPDSKTLTTYRLQMRADRSMPRDVVAIEQDGRVVAAVRLEGEPRPWRPKMPTPSIEGRALGAQLNGAGEYEPCVFRCTADGRRIPESSPSKRVYRWGR